MEVSFLHPQYFKEVAEKLPEVNAWGEAPREDLSVEFRCLLKRRMIHCAQELHAHIHEAKTTCSSQIIVWDGGHFSRPVFELMYNECKKPIDQWHRMTWQQVVRQLFTERRVTDDPVLKAKDEMLFRAATEWFLCSVDYQSENTSDEQ